MVDKTTLELATLLQNLALALNSLDLEASVTRKYIEDEIYEVMKGKPISKSRLDNMVENVMEAAEQVKMIRQEVLVRLEAAK